MKSICIAVSTMFTTELSLVLKNVREMAEIRVWTYQYKREKRRIYL